MGEIQHCPECGAGWVDGLTCQDHFYQMGFWEVENPTFMLEVHHLMVLCYHLQHPTLYSPEGLSGSKGLLVDFVEHGVSPHQVRQRDRAKLDSGNRKFKIKGTEAAHGSYAHPVVWTMTASDIINAGANSYCDSVRAWARSVLDTLKVSGNLG